MTDTILTLKQLEDIFRNLTCTLLGFDPVDPVNNDKVRIAWPAGGAPGWKITEDVVFLRIAPVNDPYAQQRDVKYSEGTTSDTVNAATSYTRSHSVRWVIYGPNSFDNAELIRNGLYGVNLNTSNLYLVLDIQTPIRAPELFDGQWWERSDLSANFYEQVTRQVTIPTIKTVNITMNTEGGVMENANITS